MDVEIIPKMLPDSHINSLGWESNLAECLYINNPFLLTSVI